MKKIINNEELQVNKLNKDCFKSGEENKRVKFIEYKIKNNSIAIGPSSPYLEKDEDNYDILINNTKNADKSNKFLNHTLNNKINNNKGININDNKYKKYIKNGYFANIGFIKNNFEYNSNKNGISLENEKNYDKRIIKNLCRNNSENNDILKKDSLISVDFDTKINNNVSKIESENDKIIYKIKINDIISNSNNNKIKKEKKDSNGKIESIEINNNKLRKNIPTPQHKNRDKANKIKKQKMSPNGNLYNTNNNNSKINSSNNVFITTNSKIQKKK